MTDDFSKKNTHLLCLDETVPSLKLEKAKEWNIPVKSREWLFSEIEKVCL
jgi:BRCT domain type II-containing protein